MPKNFLLVIAIMLPPFTQIYDNVHAFFDNVIQSGHKHRLLQDGTKYGNMKKPALILIDPLLYYLQPRLRQPSGHGYSLTTNFILFFNICMVDGDNDELYLYR